MFYLNLISHNPQIDNLHQEVVVMLKNLHWESKESCLDSIMELSAEEQLPFLNSYLKKIEGLYQQRYQHAY